MRASVKAETDLLATPTMVAEPAIGVAPETESAAQVPTTEPRANGTEPTPSGSGDQLRGAQDGSDQDRSAEHDYGATGDVDHLGKEHTRVDPSLDDGESPLFMAHRPRRSFERDDRAPSPPISIAVPGRQKGRARQSAPPSTAALWTSQLSQVAFPGRRPGPGSNSALPHARSESLPARADFAPLRGSRSPATPPPRTWALSSEESPLQSRAAPPRKRTSPSPTSRSSFRLPFLPSIPASPLPPILSPGLTRSASSPPILPALPISLPLVPEFGALQPTTTTTATFGESAKVIRSPSHPHANDDAPARSDSFADTSSRPLTSASAPNLSIYAFHEDESAAESYLPTPVTTAASTPGIADANLCFSSLTASTAPDSVLEAQDQSLIHDEELLITDGDLEDAAAEETAAAEEAVLDNNRYHALLELVETERGYLEHLRILVKVYFQTLPFLTILTLPEVQAIVRNAEQLLELHERIAERIDQVEHELSWRRDDALRVEDGPQQARKTRVAAARIAGVLAEQLPNFALYGDFCSRHAEAMDMVRIVAARPEWEAYERQCGFRIVPDSAETTPVASRSNSSIFFAEASPFSAPNSTAAPSLAPGRPIAPSTPARSVLSSSPTATMSRSAKLRFSDYAIAPVQRVTRYPMLLGQLSKYLQSTAEQEVVRSASEGFRAMAQAVDAAKREREGELRTRIVASRIEFNTPLVGGAFCDLLGPTLLVGALHVVHYNTSSGSSSSAFHNSDPWSPQAPAPSSPITSASEVVRVKYFGCFLYRTHLVMAKIKKRALYEPREWLPLRLFDIQSVEEGQGLLSHSIAVSFRDHRFELGAICAGEKAVWLSRLLKAQAEARQAWDDQELDEHGHGTLFDDSLVSSIPIFAASDAKRKTHSRSASSVSVASLAMLAPPVPVDGPRLSHDEPVPPIPHEYSVSFDERAADSTPSASQPSSQHSSPPGGTVLALVSSPQLHSRSRFSSTASSLLLGRTPSSQRAAVDLRLADVFSVECQAARAQAARDADIEATAAILAGKRSRTISGPKRSATVLSPPSSLTGGIGSSSSALRILNPAGSFREGRRMSAAEMTSGVDRSDFDGAIGPDNGLSKDAAHPSAGLELLGMTPAAHLERERSHKWSSAIRKVQRAGSSSTSTVVAPPKTRPPLPEIDTALAQAISRSGSKRSHASYAAPLSAGASWSRRGQKDRDRHGGLGGQLRRVASHSSLDAETPVGRVIRKSPSAVSMSPPAPTVSASVHVISTSTTTLKAVPSVAAEVERNNSVSSTSSSSAGAQSSSSHAHSSQALETPPSSIPPSPNLGKADLADLYACNLSTAPGTWTRFQSQTAPPRSRWSSTMSDGMSGMFRLARRKSTLGLNPPATLRPSPSASEESLTVRSVTTTSTPSDAGGAKLQRRASTTISSLFSVKRRNQSLPSLFGNADQSSSSSSSNKQARASSPHLPLDSSKDSASLEPTGGTSAPSPASSPQVQAAIRASSPQKKAGIGRATSLIRSRSRLLFTTHMTPLS